MGWVNLEVLTSIILEIIRNNNFRNLNVNVVQNKNEEATARYHNKLQLFRIHSIQMEHLVVVSTTNIIPLPYLR